MAFIENTFIQLLYVTDLINIGFDKKLEGLMNCEGVKVSHRGAEKIQK